MLLFRRAILLLAFKFFDIAGMLISLFLGYYIASNYSLAEITLIGSISDKLNNAQFLLFIICLSITWHLIFKSTGLYRSKRLSQKLGDFPDIAKATSYGALSLLGLAFFFKIEIISLIFLIIFWISNITISMTGRIIMRYALVNLRMSGRNLRFMVIVGTNPRALQFAQKIETKPELGYRIIGFVDHEWIGDSDYLKSRYPIVADFNNFVDFIRYSIVDEVMICLPIKTFYDQAFQIVSACEKQGIIIRFLPDFFDLKFTRSKIEQFETETIITLQAGPLDSWQYLIKRGFDIIISITLILTLLPFFLVIALLIKLDSHGPAVFIQERIGLNKRRFRLLKFRTMQQDAEERIKDLEDKNEVSGPVFKIRNDPRITRIGRFLRKSSLDELPQLFNVFKGDMSLVGPRPLPVRDYEGFNRDWHRRRFSVRPGITCLWQVNGRSDTPFDKWMALDMEYIDQWTFWLDIKILFKTIPVVLKGYGAS